MRISPYYLLLGAGIGLFLVLLLRNLRLALQLLLVLGKAVLLALLVLVIGWAVGLWRLPNPVTAFFLGVRRLWQPLQRSVLEWIRRTLH
ncbi:MAG: hypothetical protein PVI07_16870 [Anaerolineae bacterium]|jgi:hypothetical protein